MNTHNYLPLNIFQTYMGDEDIIETSQIHLLH